MSLSLAGAAALFGAGVAAGTVNSVAGAGSLVTFPTLLALGYGSVVATVSNTVGLVPGSVSGAFGYRREVAAGARYLRRLLPWSVAGGTTGGVLLLVLPRGVFRAVVPALVLLSAVLVLAQPRLRAGSLTRRAAQDKAAGPVARDPRNGRSPNGIGRRPHDGPGVGAGLAVFGTGAYGGYFGAAQGVLLLGILGITLPLTLQQANGVKNVLAGAVNAVAGAYFVVAAHVAWAPAGLIAAGSIIGGLIGARYGRRLPPNLLRGLVAIVGTSVAIVLFVT